SVGDDLWARTAEHHRVDTSRAVVVAHEGEILEPVDVIPMNMSDDLSGDLVPGIAGFMQLVGRLPTTVDEPAFITGKLQQRARRPVAATKGTSRSKETERVRGSFRHDAGLCQSARTSPSPSPIRAYGREDGPREAS